MKDYNLRLISQQRNDFSGGKGRCFVAGDIHGQVTKLYDALSLVNFDTSADKLIFCGDLINRGSESLMALDLLKERWFYPVMGNHDYRMLGTYMDHLTRVRTCNEYHDALENMERDERHFAVKYGSWLFNLGPCQWDRLHHVMPLIMDIPLSRAVITPQGNNLGVVHNDVWGDKFLEMQNLDPRDIRVIDHLIYNRPFVADIISSLPEEPALVNGDSFYRVDLSRLSHKNGSPLILDMDLVVHGHTVIPVPLMAGNRLYIETGGYKHGGTLTIIDADEVISIA